MALPVRYTTPIFAIGTDRLNAASITPVLRRLSSPLFQSRLPRRMYDVTAVRHAQHPDGEPVNAGKPAAVAAKAAAIDAAVFGVIVLRTDWPLATLGRAAQGLWNRVTRGRRPVTGLDTRLLAERDTIRAVLGENWRQAVVLTAGRLGFDYGCLLAALRATGASPQPSLVLLAYAAAGIVALFPLTPGGLGIVEASLSGLLILAGVRAGYAVLAVLAYRIASYWLPLLAGPPAYLLFRHRYGRPAPRPATPSEADSTG